MKKTGNYILEAQQADSGRGARCSPCSVFGKSSTVAQAKVRTLGLQEKLSGIVHAIN
jgi:hypothetical protein